MSDYRDLLERERRRFRMPHGSMEELERRRDRKRRNRRIASGIVALVIAAAGIGAGLYALRPAGNGKPVVTPTPTVAPPSAHGLLAPSGPIQFVSPEKGWAVRPNGQIVATVDGGKTWMVQHKGTMAIIGVQFIFFGLLAEMIAYSSQREEDYGARVINPRAEYLTEGIHRLSR